MGCAGGARGSHHKLSRCRSFVHHLWSSAFLTMGADQFKGEALGCRNNANKIIFWLNTYQRLVDMWSKLVAAISLSLGLSANPVTPGSARSCSIVRGFTTCAKHKSRSNNGEFTTTLSDHTAHWATAHPRQKASFRWTTDLLCTNN